MLTIKGKQFQTINFYNSVKSTRLLLKFLMILFNCFSLPVEIINLSPYLDIKCR